METNEIMTNETTDLMETAAEELVQAGSGKSFKVAAGFGLGVLAGVVICKAAKPLIARMKARRNKDGDDYVDADYEVVDDETDSKETSGK